MDNLIRDTRVLVTGGTGTLGTALLPALLNRGAEVRVLSRDEAKQGIGRTRHPDVEWMLGDVRDPRACQLAVRNVDLVIHAASLKYVDISELQPTEYALTNTLGTINILEAARREPRVRTVVGISTDKACSPFNTYGLTKALLEKLFIEAHAQRVRPVQYLTCRYGNVLGSRGSVLEKWQAARRAGTTIQITDPGMTRFFFTLADAVALIDAALGFAQSGTVLSMAMPACTLETLAKAMIGEDGKVDVIGRRPGEKTHEELISAHEAPRANYLEDGYILFDPRTAPRADGKPYTSQTARQLTVAEVRKLIGPWLS